jgi:8-demethyl-8-alpha-L-rhamnosyltetracenomycin-C 2'-O-methyltransferase
MDDIDNLNSLAIKYGADKWGKHHYTPYYATLFENRKKVRKVIEMGTGEGASLYMWRDFFPRAMIYGADIDPTRVTSVLSRMKIIGCDQSKEGDLIHLIHKTGNDIDLFVDDGSHLPQDQLFTCLTVMPMLRKDAIYVIEDVADPTIKDHILEYKCSLIRVGKRYDDQLIICRK